MSGKALLDNILSGTESGVNHVTIGSARTSSISEAMDGIILALIQPDT